MTLAPVLAGLALLLLLGPAFLSTVDIAVIGSLLLVAVFGGMMAGVFGRLPSATTIAAGAGFIVWRIGASVFVTEIAAVIAFVLCLLAGAARIGRRRVGPDGFEEHGWSDGDSSDADGGRDADGWNNKDDDFDGGGASGGW